MRASDEVSEEQAREVRPSSAYGNEHSITVNDPEDGV